MQTLAAERLRGLPEVPAVVRGDEHESGVGVMLHFLCKGRNELYAIEREAAGRIQFLFQNLADFLGILPRRQQDPSPLSVEMERRWEAAGAKVAPASISKDAHSSSSGKDRFPKLFLAQLFDDRIKERKISAVA